MGEDMMRGKPFAIKTDSGNIINAKLEGYVFDDKGTFLILNVYEHAGKRVERHKIIVENEGDGRLKGVDDATLNSIINRYNNLLNAKCIYARGVVS